MALLIIKFVLLAAVIVIAGTYLTRFADAIGNATGLGRTLAGMLLLATATSLPELAVDVSAALIPAPDLIMGDLLGSSLFNLLIIAVLDLLYRTKGPILSRQAAAHSLPAVVSMLLTGIVLLALLLDGAREVWRIGVPSIAILVTYAVAVRMIFFDQQYALHQAGGDSPLTGEPSQPEMSLRSAVIGYAVCTAAIFAAAPFLANTADELAAVTGLGHTFVGTLLVGLSTSLPEVATTRAAVRIGAYDLAVGNILGSNAFNMLVLIPSDFAYSGNLFADAAAAHAITAACVMVVTCVVLLGLLYRAERRLWVIEYDAALVILLIIGSFLLVYQYGAEDSAAALTRGRPAVAVVEPLGDRAGAAQLPEPPTDVSRER